MELYKHFSSADALENFLSGEIWLRQLEHYKYIEDESRRDETEGKYIYFDKDCKHTYELGNEVYIFCASKYFDKANIDKLGKHVAVIKDAEQLMNSIKLSAKQDNIEIFTVLADSISYTKNNFDEQAPKLENLCFQKDSFFSSENEFRIALVLKDVVHNKKPCKGFYGDTLKLKLKEAELVERFMF